MANHMEQVAEILGVKLDEDFTCKENGYVYQLTEYGIICPDHCPDYTKYHGILNAFLNGIYTIKRKPWKPTYETMYWIVKPDGELGFLRWYDDYEGYSLYKLGNCYRTAEEAKADRDKWVAFYASDEVLEI